MEKLITLFCACLFILSACGNQKTNEESATNIKEIEQIEVQNEELNNLNAEIKEEINALDTLLENLNK